jgi:hypothetical protein
MTSSFGALAVFAGLVAAQPDLPTRTLLGDDRGGRVTLPAGRDLPAPRTLAPADADRDLAILRRPQQGERVTRLPGGEVVRSLMPADSTRALTPPLRALPENRQLLPDAPPPRYHR